jgi:hypothetical protein
MTQLQLNLYENAIDSIKHAIEHYTDDPIAERRYKYAILHLAQGVTLLLKERLSKEHPNFIFKEVHNSEGKTVDVATVILRLRKIATIDLGDFEDAINDLVKVRNIIEHYAVDLSKQEADNIIGRIVPMMADFVRTEFHRDFQREVTSEIWDAMMKIQDYRRAAIQTALDIIQQRAETGHYCLRCQDNTAIKEIITRTPKRELLDEYALVMFSIKCLACLNSVSGVECQECHIDILLGDGSMPSNNSYCPNCAQKVAEQFSGFELPKYVAEIHRWFQTNKTATYTQLEALLSNVASFGPTGRPPRIEAMLQKGVVDFAYEPDRARYVGLLNSQIGGSMMTRLQRETEFIWSYESPEDTPTAK